MTGSVLQRAVKVNRKLLSIKTGPGAMILPADITRLHLAFARNDFPGNVSRHHGAKKFWREYLPSLKYHNPTVSMTVERSSEATCPAKLTIHYNASAAPKTLPETSSNDTSSVQTPTFGNSFSNVSQTKEINMKSKSNKEILERFIKVSEAKPAEILPSDIQLKGWIDNIQEKSIKEANIMKLHNAKRKRQEDMMAAARGKTA